MMARSYIRRFAGAALVAATVLGTAAQAASAAWIWVEGENATRSTMHEHPWYNQVKKNELSGGKWISNFDEQKRPALAAYTFNAPEAGKYDFWIRANPTQAKIEYSLNNDPPKEINLANGQTGNMNIAADNKPDLRFIAWEHVGEVELKAGENQVAFRFSSENSHHGGLDCFVLSTDPFTPNGILKPNQMAEANKRMAQGGWFPWNPSRDNFQESPLDMRWLNEKQAGDGGFIAVKNGDFVHSNTGETVRFWAVNGGPWQGTPDEQAPIAKLLAKHGVNLCRFHGAAFAENGSVNQKRVASVLASVDALKKEGIYTHLSIYFPLWMNPKGNMAGLKGYPADGSKHPFATLFFDPDFQQTYRSWWKGMLTTPGPDGKAIIDNPAVMGIELLNEDSYFFWTFTYQNIPAPEMAILEKQFGDWLIKKYGSLDKAQAAWNGMKDSHDDFAAGRVGFRPLYNIAHDKTPRDQDTADFLYYSQHKFYADTIDYIRSLGYKGLITCSNWTTADNTILGPLERMSYTAGDFIDRHGYFECGHTGDNAAWSIRDGHEYFNRSALRFDGPEPGKPKAFTHPVMDVKYDHKPSMISETTFTRPNRYRTEAALYYAAYGALQDSNCQVHFAFDSSSWTVKPGFWMQQWTLMSPTMVGQFPAAALLYRKGLVATGDEMADVNLTKADVLALKGTPLPEIANLDELRKADVPDGQKDLTAQTLIDPLIHYVGQTNVNFVDSPTASTVKDYKPYIDYDKQTIDSSTGQLHLDFGNGVLLINAPQAQGVDGNLKAAGNADLKDVSVQSDMDLGSVIVVSLDGQPIASSSKLLLQVMSEEENHGWKTHKVGDKIHIDSIGNDPWMVKDISGTVALKRADASQLKVQALDLNGYPAGDAGTADKIALQPQTVYYVISK